MNTRRLGLIRLDYQKVNQDLAKIMNATLTDAYRDYAVGKWQVANLLNEGGRNHAGSTEHNSTPLPTPNLSLFPYIAGVIASTFQPAHLKSVRLMVVSSNGFILPHMDYLEFERGFTRIHIPLATNNLSFHCEEDTLFHMRLGEAWFLNGRRVHSAGCFSPNQRIHLIADFAAEVDPESVFLPGKLVECQQPPAVIARSEFTEDELESIRSMVPFAHEANFKDIAALLGRVHFFKKVHPAQVYEWLIDLGKAASNPEFERLSRQLKAVMVERGPEIRTTHHERLEA
jgi:hypothetical protein